MQIQIAYADLTTETTDAVVNAANSGLYAGGGVCGAIHNAAGPRLQDACMAIEGVPIKAKTGERISEDEARILRGETRATVARLLAQGVKRKNIHVRNPVFTERCSEGDAVATPGFDLPARHIIHAVGPIWRDGESGEATALDACHRSIIRVADQLGATSISLPTISTGIFGFPLDQAAPIALRTLIEAGVESDVELIRITVIDDKNRSAFADALTSLTAEDSRVEAIIDDSEDFEYDDVIGWDSSDAAVNEAEGVDDPVEAASSRTR